MLEACRRSPMVRQIVVASSDKAYGSHDQLPYSEDAPLQGRHPYDVSKSCADLIAQSYAVSHALPVCVTRCGNLYGGGDLNWNRIIPGTIRSVLNGEHPIIRSDGSYIRDYFYVEDGALAYLMLAEQLAARREVAGEAFNFSNEIQVTVLEIANLILRLMNWEDLRLTCAGGRNRWMNASVPRRCQGTRNSPMETALRFGRRLPEDIAWYASFFANKEGTNDQRSNRQTVATDIG